jgi:hypothetical protein
VSSYSVTVQIAPTVLVIPVMAVTGRRPVQVMADEYIPPVFNTTATKKRVSMLITSVTWSAHLPVNHISITAVLAPAMIKADDREFNA